MGCSSAVNRERALRKLDGGRRRAAQLARAIGVISFGAGVALATLGAAPAGAAAPAGLPRLAIEPAGITVSGASSGGYMATQFQVAHSALVRGAGIFGAGPWYCARGSMGRALGECFDKATSRPGGPELIAEARRLSTAGRIDDVRGLADDRVWLFRGTRDDKVAKPVADALAEFYRAFVPAANLVYVETVPAAHGVPTVGAGAACGTTAEPFLNACDYDGAGALLAHLYGPLAKPAKAAAPRAFDQRRYDVDGALAPQGWVYVPAACARGERCRLHVAFHGCRQGEDFVGATFVNHAGYNRWAEANRIVVLYPQVRKSLLLPLNPQGCWDWWGYAGADYATRDGAQVRAVRAMVRALAGL